MIIVVRNSLLSDCVINERSYIVRWQVTAWNEWAVCRGMLRGGKFPYLHAFLSFLRDWKAPTSLTYSPGTTQFHWKTPCWGYPLFYRLFQHSLAPPDCLTAAPTEQLKSTDKHSCWKESVASGRSKLYGALYVLEWMLSAITKAMQCIKCLGVLIKSFQSY